jgi:hypothetical protein
MRRLLLACWTACVCLKAAGLSYQVTDGGSACREVQVPGWTKPYDYSECQYDFRSPREGVVYLGLSCNVTVSWARSPEKYALIPILGKTLEGISQAQWDAAPVLWTSEQGYGSGGRSDSIPYVEYKGQRFLRSGPKWPGKTSKDLLTPANLELRFSVGRE